MVTRSYLTLISSFICVLILCLPVAIAQQATLSLDRVSGTNTNKNGFYRTDEGITIEATAGLATDPNGVSADQMRLYIDGNRNMAFQSCEDASPITKKCSLITPTSPAAGVHMYEVRLYDDTNKFNEAASPATTARQSMIADTTGAQVTELMVIPIQIKDGKVQIRYRAIDTALPYTSASACSGIRDIQFYLDDSTGSPFHTVTGDQTCWMQGVASYTFPSLSNGAHMVIAKATDTFGQTGTPAAVAFIMDNAAPNVEAGSVTVTRSSDGTTLLFVRSAVATNADVQVRLSKENLTAQNVKADFNAMSTSPGFRDRPADSIDGRTATWRNIPIIGMTSCSIVVRATDSLGNTAASTVSCNVRNDDTGPTVSSMETSVRDGAGAYYIGKEGQLIITFSDDGSGVNSSTAYAGLADITGRSPVGATNCQTNGASHRCVWNITATRMDGTKQVSAHRQTTDMIGNPLQAEQTLNVILDTEPPIIKSITHRIVEGPSSSGVDPGVATQGSNIEFTLNASGFDPAKVFANFSSLGGNGGTQMTCADGSCTAVTPVSASGPIEAQVGFIVSDTAGNNARANRNIIIAGYINGTPNFWKSATICSPLIDRTSSSLISQRVYCDGNLQSLNLNARVANMAFRGITSCSGNFSKFISSIDGINIGPGSRNPTFGLSLFATEFNMNELSLTCPVEITTIVNTTGKIFVTQTPEIENITMTVKFYNLPLSEMDKNLQQQVDDAVKSAKDNLKFIGQLNKFFEFASRICNLKVVFTNLMEGFNAIKNLFGGAGLGSLPGTPTREVLKQNYQRFCHAEQTTSKKSEDMLGFLDKICTFINCRAEVDDGDGAGAFLAKLGGGSAHCKGIQNALGSIGGANGLSVPDLRDKYSYLGGQGVSMDVKNSLIMSSLCLCVPGIISNLNKMREIKCQYALCMAREVKEGGLPVSYCKDVESYMYCNFLVGDVFSILPIFRLWDQVMNIIKNIYANPFEAIPLLIGVKCAKMCDTPEQLMAHQGCILPKTLAKIGDAIGSVKSIKNMKDYFKPGAGGYCDQLDKFTKEKK